MNTDWQIEGKDYQLFRFPPKQHDKALQAWDSADELVIQNVLDSFKDEQCLPSLTIYDDLFGAISVALHRFKPVIVTDSYISQLGIKHNHDVNHLNQPLVITALDSQKPSDLVIIKLTKNLAYLEHQLQSVSAYHQNSKLIAAGKTTLVTSSVIKLFEKYCINVSTSLAKKKSRLIFATPSHNPELIQSSEQGPAIVAKHQISPAYKCEWFEQDLTLHAFANVFSKDQIDIGGRFLADHLPPAYFSDQTSNSEPFNVVDLGCGNGLVGLSYLMQNQRFLKRINLIFCDESNMAVESARLNVEKNLVSLIDDSNSPRSQCQFIQDDCLSSQLPNTIDLVLCNPPFHQQNAITTHITEQMIKQSAKALKPGGNLVLVANRHLPYQNYLKSAFGGLTILATNAKFVIYSCEKLRTA